MTVYRYGGFWRRCLALCIDKFILNTLFLVLVLLEILILPVQPYSYNQNSPGGIWNYMTVTFIVGHIIVFVVMSAAYFTYFHGSIGQTPGKMILNVKVISAQGKDLTYGTAFLRWLCYLVSGMFFTIGFIWAAFDSKKQAWHDKIAGTVVVLGMSGGQSNSHLQMALNI